jgi:tetratricopeptide (TPR) repeat protein
MLTSRTVSPAPAARLIFVAALCAIAVLFASTPARAQGTRAPIGGPGGEHAIYGEFKIDDSKVDKERSIQQVPGSFVLVLMNEAGRVIERQAAMNGTTFWFRGLRNGLYEIVVESGGLPAARLRLHLDSPRRVELKQDITLAWDTVGGSKGDPKKGVISAAEFYDRPAATRDAFERATAAIRKKKFSDAATLLRQIVEADVKDHLAWAHLGSVHNALGNAAEAERAYERALELRPDLLAASVNLGRIYLLDKGDDKAAKVVKAVGVLKLAAEKHSESADVHYLLGEAYLATRKFAEAYAHFQEAIRLDPKGKADAHLRLAAIQDAAGSKDKAAAELEQFIAKRPDHPNRRQFEQYVKDNKKH